MGDQAEIIIHSELSTYFMVLDLFDLRAMLGFERRQSANKGLPLGSVIDQLGGIDGVETSRMEVVFD